MSRRPRGSEVVRWLELKPRAGIWTLACGKYAGWDLDDLADDGQGARYLRWILHEAAMRPGPEEELAIREALGEVGEDGADDEWVNVLVGRRSFRIPRALGDLFCDEISRLRTVCSSDVQAFEALVAGSATTPLESLGV